MHEVEYEHELSLINLQMLDARQKRDNLVVIVLMHSNLSRKSSRSFQRGPKSSWRMLIDLGRFVGNSVHLPIHYICLYE